MDAQAEGPESGAGTVDWDRRLGPHGEPGTPGPALDAIAGLGAAAFATVVLWSLPGFLGLPPGTPIAAAVATGGLFAYVVAGPHTGPPAVRRGVPLALLAAVAVLGLAAVLLPGPGLVAARVAGTVVAGFTAWGTKGVLSGPAAWMTAWAAGWLVGLPVFHTARRGRPTIALLLGFALLVFEWEFVDGATVRLFWPLTGVALFWLAADRARETARGSEVGVGAPTPWTAFGMAGLAGLAVLGSLLLLPRQGGPANLGALGIWIDRLPVIGTLEKSTREGSLGYATGAGRGNGGQGGAGGTAVGPSRTGGFSLSQTGFGGSTAVLGGPVHPNRSVALWVSVPPGGHPPSVLYLRGSVRDVFTGAGWVPGPGEQQAYPTWPAANAGSVGRDFVSGAGIPAPFRLLNARITLRGSAPSADLFTVLSPLRLSVPVTWDRSGEAWLTTPPPQGFTYTLSSASLDPGVYASTALAPFTATGLPPGGTVSPQEALRLAEAGRAVTPAPAPNAPRLVGAFPSPADLQLPGDLPARDRALARSWVRGLHDPLLEALAVQAHLRRLPYSLNPPATPAGRDFVDYFLFHVRSGYCTYFSSAMAVLLRTLDIPTRWVEGFRTSVPAGGGTFAVRNSAAHAWVEAYLPPYGWLTFDPTPLAVPAGTQVGPAQAQPARRPGAWGLHLGLPRALWVVLGAPGAFGLLLLSGALGNLLAERRRFTGPVDEAQAIWRACERVGARFGRRRHRDETPAEYAQGLGQAFPRVSAPAGRLAAAYGRLRYGRPGQAAGDTAALRADWLALQTEWRAAAPLSYPWRRWL